MENKTTYHLHFTFLLIYITADEHICYCACMSTIKLHGCLPDKQSGNPIIRQIKVQTMNGRVYDPLLGRFLSPDNYVQSASYTQTFNRYTYCFNNPLSYTDPNGENPLVGAAVLIGFLYIKNAHDNTSGANQNNPAKWNWGFWNWSKSNTTVVVGYNTNFDDHTFYAGINENGTEVGVKYNSGLHVYPASRPHNININWSAVNAARQYSRTAEYYQTFYGAAQIGKVPISIKSFSYTQNKNSYNEFKGYYYNAPVYESKLHNSGTAVTLPPDGIFVGKGVYDSKVLDDIMILRHEYGHWLQYEDRGLFYYYSVIAPSSLASATSNINHMDTWVEVDANNRAYYYLNMPTDWDPSYPIFSPPKAEDFKLKFAPIYFYNR